MTAEAHVPLSCDPGEACQFDWSHEIVVIAGVTITVKVAHVRLCHSRMMFARAYMREIEPLSAIGPRTMDAKTAVEAVFSGKERHYNRRFLQMCSHFLVDPPSTGLEPMAHQ